ncbi:DUF6392 family protein [Pseudomonas tremae]|uniref:Pyocin immunity protein n=2 Tax=Pseudomonas syringae group TaxID=136849 RepID=A0ABY1U0I7_PSESX|nr:MULTISPECIES: DUF6392 family protein [Pseudomonas syringae group]KWT11714.1 hypothetical protein AL046_15350 [Pseudomonas syringae pv. avii]MCF5711517.1 hypothetical protein [Pseudomonas tremae]MCF5747398.1 hypothetical protein [Pseudomonas tremae]MCQ2988046.1 DUF6392 family protein [Pseudomonas tremae]PHN56968.1 hypothetical protein AO286_16415 [Pseudomonas syringae]
MSALMIETWISNLGRTYGELVSKSLVHDDGLIELFPGIDELYLEPQLGLSMSFWAETERLESICITLLKSTPSTVAYTGELPAPYRQLTHQTTVRALLGEPLESSGPVKLPEPMGITGGWEYYSLSPETYPNTRLQIQYLESMDVNAIVFSLIDKGR